jgi:hypothetical protein
MGQSPRGDKSPLTKALTSQRTPKLRHFSVATICV